MINGILDGLVIVLTSISLAIIYGIVEIRAARAAGQRCEIPQDGNVRIYKVSAWTYLSAWGILCLGLGAIVSGIMKIEPTPPLFLCGCGSIFFLMGLYGIYHFRRTFVKLGTDDLVYSSGGRKKRVDFRTIRNVFMLEGMMFIDIGEKQKVIIPTMFRKTSEIYSVLCKCARESKANGVSTFDKSDSGTGL